jgi:hypothetical protein
MGLLASTIDPARVRASEPEVMVAQADTAHAAATMNIPF